MVAPGGTILRRDSTLPADGNTPCPPDACSELSEEDLRVLLATHDDALLRHHLTRIPRAPDDPVEVVESGVTSRPFARICRLQARTVDEL